MNRYKKKKLRVSIIIKVTKKKNNCFAEIHTLVDL